MTDAPSYKITPMFEQYFAFKEENPDALLFFRMGDFYEMFFDDAEVAARELQITLTSRNSSAENPIPMCGVPHHAAENYLRQLNEKGYKVAICEQVEDPKAAKGLVKRAVIEVRTPGTTVDEAALDAKGHNYLGAFYWDKDKEQGGFVWLDYSTGSWSGLHGKKENELWQWVQKMQPRELLVPDLPAEEFSIPLYAQMDGITPVRLPVRAYFDLRTGTERIFKAQGIRELGAVGLENKEELARACGAILTYLLQTQKQELTHLAPFVPLNLNKHLALDEITERNLEIFRRLDGKKGPGTLWQVLDETITPMGGRMLEERLRHPWRELSAINECADMVDWFFEQDHKRGALREGLKAMYDIERLTTRVSIRRAMPRDYVALRNSLAAIPGVLTALKSTPMNVYAIADQAEGRDLPLPLQRLMEHWDNLEDLSALLGRAIVDSPPVTVTEGGLFKPGYHAELDTLIDLSEHGESLLGELFRKEQEQSGLAKLKMGFNRVFGYYFEVPKSSAATVPEHFVRRQTVTNAERFITPQLKELEDRILAAREERNKLEYQLFQGLRDAVYTVQPRIMFMAAVIAGLDYWQSLAETARKRRWVRPRLHEGNGLLIREGRHPVVEALAGPQGFVPNSLRMDEKRRLIIITGPNMAGKSTVLRQAAIIVILAQMGGFVPATDAEIGIADRIFSRVGASDNLAQGQSTFMVEMMETARILRQAGKRSLVILDEIGRGTSTFDGLSLAWAVVEDLARRADSSVRTLFATHYHELTALEGRIPGVHNMNIAATESRGEILFTRRLVPGPADKSYGIEVAKLAGVPQNVVQRAKKILEILDKSRSAGFRQQTAEAMQQLLPGLEGTMHQMPDPPELLPPLEAEVDHPLFTSLRDLDTNNLTPMQALALINEWKLLWGGEKE